MGLIQPILVEDNSASRSLFQGISPMIFIHRSSNQRDGKHNDNDNDNDIEDDIENDDDKLILSHLTYQLT